MTYWRQKYRDYPWLRAWRCGYWGSKKWCLVTPLFGVSRETLDHREYRRCNRLDFFFLARWKRPYGELIWLYSKRFEFAPLPDPFACQNSVEHNGSTLSVASTEKPTTTLH